MVVLEEKVGILENFTSFIEECLVNLERAMVKLQEQIDALRKEKVIVILYGDVPKLKTYNGKQDAKKVEDFLRHMECYFDIAQISNDQAKVQIISYYLT